MMRRLKGLISNTVAFLFMCSVICTSSAAAVEPSSMDVNEVSRSSTVYDPCDVNHSGTVDIIDYIALSKYLQGMLRVDDYN